MQMRRFRGRRTAMSFRLCSRAPWTTSSSAAMWRAFYRDEQTFGKRLVPLLEQPREPARHVVHLELPRDDGAVAEDASEQRPLDLEHRPVARDRGGPTAQEPMLDDERVPGDGEVRPVPAGDPDDGGQG